MHQQEESRTRKRLITAFNQLVFDKTRGPIRVGQIVDKAGVGRSTFYDHFANAEAVHMAALSRPLTNLAAPAAGTGTSDQLERLLDHFLANRPRAREILVGPSRDRVARLLGQMIEERVEADGETAIPVRLGAMQIAEAMLSVIRLWIVGEFAATPRVIAASLFETATAMRVALRLTPKPAAQSD